MIDGIFSAFSDSQPGAWVQDGMVVSPPVRARSLRPTLRGSVGAIRTMTITLTTSVTFMMASPTIPLHLAGSGPVAVVLASDGRHDVSAQTFEVIPLGALREARDYLRGLAKVPPPEHLDLDCFV